ncbi:tripartite tricarboxylate transporter substrate binding protein [Sporosarcina highlanderae]|uniref:Tripartite tricarboxylate transporter substrate binding protein n=1 Tax=Sporosarcina highlanderae TaxID=3035916 RepID=A0ABT8JSM9_9BACL|nr:tripartite tricarboxylate transporter substrate binding protein [Sporosarcina highlanderae]MDN4608089.1 tripartite tricarboxylate transporter substrate binding protein [Sporosarcina highlanderae]
MKKVIRSFLIGFILLLPACSAGSKADIGDQDFPTVAIEIIAPASAGGGWDTAAHAVRQILIEEKLVEQDIHVVNKPGGSGEVGWQHLSNQDGHHIAFNSSLLLTNHLVGQSKLQFRDFTPLAILTTEWIAVAVPNNSPFQDAKELLEQLKEDPSSLKIAVAPGLANNDHLSFLQAAKAFGVDVLKLNFLVYDSGGDIVDQLLYGQIDVAISSVSEFIDEHQTHQFKVIAVTSDERLEGLEDVATWKEQGVDMVFPHWRGIMGPPDMTEEEIAYWNQTIKKMTETEAWRKLIRKYKWESFYKGSSEAKRFLEEQERMYRQLLEGSGLVD